MNTILLNDLITLIDNLLSQHKSTTVKDTTFEYASFMRLESCIETIFKDGIKLFKPDGSPDIYSVMQPAINLELNPPSQSPKEEFKGLVWLFQCLENNCLSQHLQWLLSDNEQMSNCYESSAFLRNEKYVDALMICLNAFERAQSNLLSQIDPSLYNGKAGKENYKCHKRSSSHPHFSIAQQKPVFKPHSAGIPKRRKTMDTFQKNRMKLKKNNNYHLHLRAWKSLPNIFTADTKIELKKTSNPEVTVTPSKSIVITVPQFDYNEKPSSIPKTASQSVLNCTDIKIHVHEGSWIANDNSKSKKSSQSVQSDVAQLLSLAGSPRTFFNEFIPQYGEKINKSPHVNAADHILNTSNSRPIAGQSLTSFLKTIYFSRTNAELDRENAHFSLSEALIATFEQLKWNDAEKTTNKRLKRRISASSFASSCSSRIYSPHRFGMQQYNDASKNISPSSVVSEESASTAISSDADNSHSDNSEKEFSEENLNAVAWEETNVKAFSAEGVALSLISKFSDKQLPTASDLLWLVSEQDAPQQLLPMPNGHIVNPDDHCSINTFIRGTKEWAPPRAQIIFTRHQPPDRKQLMIKQNQRCCGCGMKVAAAYSHRFRYCEYLGKYNCSGCHKNQMSSIPARVIDKWDFSLHPVSVFSYRLLNDLWTYPLFRINDLNANLYNTVRILYAAKMIRIQLKFIKDFITTCRFSESLKTLFTNIPSHLTIDIDIWSMADFVAVKNRSFHKDVTDFIKRCEKHIFECELCRARGFHCENCRKKDVIFPWQNRIMRCKVCGACFHDSCWTKDCIKCERMQKRKVVRK